MYAWLGSQSEIWIPDPSTLVEVLQKIWNTIHTVEHEVTDDGPVYGVVSPHILYILSVTANLPF